MVKRAKSLTIGYADFETEHHLDLESKGIHVSIVGNELRDQYGNIPTVGVKCCGLIVRRKDGSAHEYMFHSVKELLQGLVDEKVDRCYFHNLKFDDSFIASYMKNDEVALDGGWSAHSESRLINNRGAVYSDVIAFTGRWNEKTHRNGHVCEIWDSAKIWASSLRSLGESFGVYKKGEDHEEALRVGCDERMEEYCLQDCRVMMAAMEYYFQKCNEESNGKRPYGWMTAGSTAYHLCMMHVRAHMTSKAYKDAFPACNELNRFPSWLREGFKGAVPLLDPTIRNVPLHDVKVFDINSQYPDKLRNYPMPIGRPVRIKEMDMDHLMKLKEQGRLWVAKVKMIADVKEGHRATYLLKRKGGEDDETLCWHINDVNGMFDDKESFQVVTSVDMDYILRDYDIRYMEVLDAIGFKTDIAHVIAPFIDKWYEIKEVAASKKDKPLKAFAKLILNALYGKFGTNPEHISSEYVFEGDMIRVKETENVDVDKHPLYLPIAMFTTCYARDVISKTCNEIGWEHVAYTDTDSVHIHGLTNEQCYERIKRAGYKIHPTELGAYDYESRWGDALYVRNKGYYHFNEMDIHTGEITGDKEIKMAGANGFDGFTCLEDVVDKELTGKQTRGYRVNGGILLMDKDVAIDTRMDACLKSKKRIRGMNYEQSEIRIKEIENNIWEEFGVI